MFFKELLPKNFVEAVVDFFKIFLLRLTVGQIFFASAKGEEQNYNFQKG